METSLLPIAYMIYLPVALIMTGLVAHALFKNSKIFMMDIFNGREEIAISTNKLFEIGFYLLNMGTALLILQLQEMDNMQEMIENLSYKLGSFSIYLGIMLFLNLFMFFRGKRKAKAATERALALANLSR
jgi:uncharacterized membrane protein